MRISSAAALPLLLLALSGSSVSAQAHGGGHGDATDQAGGHGEMHQHMQEMMQQMMGGGSSPGVGQDAFDAISRQVRALEADPATDWSTVDIEALRQHLIDMHEVTLNAVVRTTPVEGGAQFEVEGMGRAVESIQRMAHAHAHETASEQPFSFEVQITSVGARVRVVARDASDERAVQKIRALGFVGLLTLGDHHLPHHAQMSTGEAPEGHQH